MELIKEKVEKIWVCGPPRMNEDFERWLKFLSENKVLPKDCYEVI